MEKRPQIWAIATILSLMGFYLLSAGVADRASHRSDTLNELAQEDLKQLNQSKNLPAGIHDLYEIEKIPTDKVSKIWSSKLDLNLKTQPQGHFKLEVLVLQEESEHLTAILQYHLIHRDSGNSVWELARQYKLYAD